MQQASEVLTGAQRLFNLHGHIGRYQEKKFMAIQIAYSGSRYKCL